MQSHLPTHTVDSITKITTDRNQTQLYRHRENRTRITRMTVCCATEAVHLLRGFNSVQIYNNKRVTRKQSYLYYELKNYDVCIFGCLWLNNAITAGLIWMKFRNNKLGLTCYFLTRKKYKTR